MSLKPSQKNFPANFAYGGKNGATIDSSRLIINVNSPLESFKNVMGIPKRKLHPNWTSIIRKPNSAKTFVKNRTIVIEKVDSERLKTISELTQLLRWEDDGGAVFETGMLLPQVAEVNTPRSMDVAGDDLLYDELKNQLLNRR